MVQPLKTYVFRPVNDAWVDVKGDGELLADVLRCYDLVIDDKCEFARFKDLEHNLEIWYRVRGALCISIDVWELVS